MNVQYAEITARRCYRDTQQVGAVSNNTSSGAGSPDWGSLTGVPIASASVQGIASFNSTNFAVVSGVVNTIQNIHSGASPTFAGLSLNGTLNIGSSGVLQIGGTIVIDASRNLTNIGTISSGLINAQTISSAANFTGTMYIAGDVGIGRTSVTSLGGNRRTLDIRGGSDGSGFSFGSTTTQYGRFFTDSNMILYFEGNLSLAHRPLINSNNGMIYITAASTSIYSSSGVAGGGTLIVGTVQVTGLTASRFVQTDGTKNLASFDLFGTANTWNATQAIASITLTTALAVASGGTGVTALSDVLGTTNQITVTGGTARVIGSNVTLSLPQNIHSAASPTFAGMNLSGLTTSRFVQTDGSKYLISFDLFGTANTFTAIQNAGSWNATTAFTVGGITVIDTNRNILNAGNATFTGSEFISGNLAVGASSTYGYRLYVNGPVLIDGSVTVTSTGPSTFGGMVSAPSLTDGYNVFTSSQINRSGGTVELQYNADVSGLVRMFGGTSAPITFYNGSGKATFAGTVISGIGTSTATPHVFYASDYYSGAGHASFVGNWASSGAWGIGAKTATSDFTLKIAGVDVSGAFNGQYAHLYVFGTGTFNGDITTIANVHGSAFYAMSVAATGLVSASNFQGASFTDSYGSTYGYSSAGQSNDGDFSIYGWGGGSSVNCTDGEIDFSAGSLIFNGNSTFYGGIYPGATDTYDIGSSSVWFRQQYVSQINATIFAEQTQSLVGGWFTIGKDQGKLPVVYNNQTQIDFAKAMTVGHFIVIKGFDFWGSVKVEYMQIASLVSGTTYNVTRDLANANTPDPTWADGTPYLLLGTNGSGRIELNAYDTPRISIMKQGAAYNDQTEVLRIGDISGLAGVVGETYGFFVGSASKYLCYNSVADTLTVTGTVNAGAGTFSNTVYVGTTSSRILIDGTNKKLQSENYVAGSAGWAINGTGSVEFSSATIRGSITATTGAIGGWTISGSYIGFNYEGTGYNGCDASNMYLYSSVTDSSIGDTTGPSINLGYYSDDSGTSSSIDIGVSGYRPGYGFSIYDDNVGMLFQTYVYAGNSVAQIAGWSFNNVQFWSANGKVNLISNQASVMVDTGIGTTGITRYINLGQTFDGNSWTGHYGISIIRNGPTELMRVDDSVARIAGWSFSPTTFINQTGVYTGGERFTINLSNSTYGSDGALNYTDANYGALRGMNLVSYDAVHTYGWRITIGQMSDQVWYMATSSKTGYYGIEMVTGHVSGAWTREQVFRLSASQTSGTLDCSIAGWNFDSYRIYGQFLDVSSNSAYPMGIAVSSGAGYVNAATSNQCNWGAINAGFSIGGNTSGGAWIAHYGRVRSRDGNGYTSAATFSGRMGIQFNAYGLVASNYVPIFEVSTGTGAAGDLIATIAGWSFDNAYLWTGTKQTSDTYSSSGITIASAGSIRSPQFFIGTNGNAYFKGAVSGATISGGSISVGGFSVSSGQSQLALFRASSMILSVQEDDNGELTTLNGYEIAAGYRSTDYAQSTTNMFWKVGQVGPCSEYGVGFSDSNHAIDSILYRSAASVLTTSSKLIISVAGGNKTELQITSTTAGTGITVGGDTNLYRLSANTWQTDDNFSVAGSISSTMANNSAVFAHANKGRMQFYTADQAGVLSWSNNALNLGFNSFEDGTTWQCGASGAASSIFRVLLGSFTWNYRAASSSAVPTTTMLLDSSGNLVALGNVTSNGSPSDIRYKSNVRTIKDGLSIIRSLNPVGFEWNDVSDHWRILGSNKNRKDYGFVAQDVIKVLPNIVSSNDAGFLSIKYDRMIPFLASAVQEIDSDVTMLKNRVAELECKVKELEAL